MDISSSKQFFLLLKISRFLLVHCPVVHSDDTKEQSDVAPLAMRPCSLLFLQILFELMAKGGAVKGLIKEKDLVQALELFVSSFKAFELIVSTFKAFERIIVDPVEIEKMVVNVVRRGKNV
ncbi:hypothetical protein RHMOL_Rhmol02G0206600 [Rhododendron molle]|uniref:Uncharacterized protein n=1 Tax=Rhododendron molle TaxID=49168 RepID=A0ACC0PTN8_RHOML|nr:hypothetical protein RHMOL_Rhmol02G0206600 [Rhododendron molle]